MLTKQEREEIAERFRNYDKAECITLYSGMYDGLLGEHVPKETTVKKERMELASRIIDLCDTSNMLELPVDKDGEYIHINDTVYDKDGKKHVVLQFEVLNGRTDVVLSAGTNPYCVTVFAHDLTHEEPITAKLLAQQLRNLAECERGYTPTWTLSKLVDIAEKLEHLGDNDE